MAELLIMNFDALLWTVSRLLMSTNYCGRHTGEQYLQTEVEELNTELASAKALIGQLQANIDGGATAKTYAAVASTAAVTKSSNGTKRRPTSGRRLRLAV